MAIRWSRITEQKKSNEKFLTSQRGNGNGSFNFSPSNLIKSQKPNEPVRVLKKRFELSRKNDEKEEKNDEKSLNDDFSDLSMAMQPCDWHYSSIPIIIS